MPMHRERHNALELGIRLTIKSPLLIKSGGISTNPSLPDMQFVRTFVNGAESIYVPGSSLKGIFRSYVEKVLRTKKGHEGACDIVEKEKSCNKKLEEIEKTLKDKEGRDIKSEEIYKESCRTCKIFGNTRLKSRASITDAYPSGEIKTETRHGVAISRLTHAVAQGPFDMEVAVSGTLCSKIYLENFEMWQLGTVALAIKGLNDGLIRIGFGKNRGFGEVAVNVETVQFTLASDVPPAEIWGVGKSVSKEIMNNYGFVSSDAIIIKAKPDKIDDDIIYRIRKYSSDSWDEISSESLSKLKGILS